MIVRFETASGSVYELDEAGKRIRRVSGRATATARQGDGEWRTFESISEIRVGWQVSIEWPKSVPLLEGSPSGFSPATVTSSVVRMFARVEVKS